MRTQGGHAPATLVAVLCACAAAGCARPGPPGGGPVDSTPPVVVRTAPADGATDVPSEALIEIEFSEEMSRESAERALSVAPAVPLEPARWRATTLVTMASGGLPDSTTFVVTVGAGAQDYHGVAVAAPRTIAFSTGPVVDSCVVSGSVGASGVPVQGATVWLSRNPALPDSTGVLQPSERAALTNESGAFRFAHVGASRVAYSIIAFLDADRDGRYDPADETGAVLDAAARVSAPGDSVGGIDIALTPPGAGEGAEE